jgi:hypothetical protein
MVTDFLFRLLDEMTIGLALGLTAFTLHIAGYAWYFAEILRGNTRPNAAYWLMCLVGAVVETYTYDAIGSHWSTSALPIACVVGVCVITLTTGGLQLKLWLKGRGEVAYESSDKKDYYLVGVDIVALALYEIYRRAFWANFLAVASSIVTFIPIWKTTLRSGHERPGPWVVWCFAYYFMWLAVLAEGRPDTVWEKSFYPLYYLALHAVVAFLAIGATRNWTRQQMGMAASEKIAMPVEVRMTPAE